MADQIVQFAKYARVVKQMGLPGLQVVGERARPQWLRGDPSREAQMPLPGGQQKVWLRPGTSDWVVFEKVFVKEEYGTLKMRQHAELVRRYDRMCASGRPPLILDCGANVGLSAVWFALAWPRATVVAIEPEPANFQLLARNATLFPAIQPIHAGVWDTPTTLGIVDAAAEPWAMRVAEEQDSSRGLRAVTVPEVLEQYGQQEIFIAKIDIEGAEHELFRSNTEWLDNVELVVIEFHDWLHDGECRSNNFLRAALRRDREILIVGENVFCLRR